jgi:hypothetical protein
VFPDKGFFYEGIVYSEGGVGGPAFSSAQHAGSLGPARLMARRIDLARATKFLDVGGSSGAYTLAFLKQNPRLRATILYFPDAETTQTAQCYAAEAASIAAPFEHAKACAAEVGFVLQDTSLTGGVSDGNFSAALGILTLDGRGAGGRGAHTLDEQISFFSPVLRGQLLVPVLETLR